MPGREAPMHAFPTVEMHTMNDDAAEWIARPLEAGDGWHLCGDGA